MELFEQEIIGLDSVNSLTHNTYIVNKNAYCFEDFYFLKITHFLYDSFFNQNVNDLVCYDCGKVFQHFVNAVDHVNETRIQNNS